MILNRVSSIRSKLVCIFVLIKVVPLLALAALAWQGAELLGAKVAERSTSMADKMLGTIKTVGDTVIDDASRALDDRSREAIERLTTDTARAIAAFLRDRDQDIVQAAQVRPSQATYRAFLLGRDRDVFSHGPWRLSADGKGWEPAQTEGPASAAVVHVQAELADNAKDYHARSPEYFGRRELRPLFVEMTFIGLDGRERVKVRTGAGNGGGLADVRDRLQTFAKAESYWSELQALKPGDIFVSEVIGSYVGSQVVGPYTPQAAAKAGIPFAPEQSAYAGTENPVGKRFRGIVRWATPVVANGKVTGYVTLALDHDHLRQFTDRLMPTEARYTPIIDAIQGNYAFLWDHKGRAISHPRDYFIVGYNANTGLPETPWMDQSLYEAWKASGQPSSEFLAQTPPFLEPSLKKKPAQALVKAGTIALDCRYLNFAPQCQGFEQLTRDGGSGSFVIFFAGLWKLTTAAAIPYHTGPYANDPRGFGFVTIGANVADFHQATTASGQRIAGVIAQRNQEFAVQRAALIEAIQDNLSRTAGGLIVSTGILVVLVILIAIWMADVLTRRITSMVEGIRRFQDGDHGSRLVVKSRDEMGLLAASFNGMADAVQDAFARMSRELEMRRQAEQQLLIAAAAFDSQEAICVTDANGVILRVNQAFAELTGYSVGELVGQNPRMLQSGRHDAAFYAAMWQRIAESGFWEGEIWDKRKNGEVYPKWLTITAIKSTDGAVTNYVSTQTDITARKAAEDEIKYLAFYDSLTGLPNRRLLMDRLRKALATSTRSGKHGALLFVDMDNFKVLNDTLGHHMGDLLLKQVAQRLVSCVREADTVARLGGDEFVVMLEDLGLSANDAATQTEIVGNKVLAVLEPIYRIETHDYRITPSMGATLFSGHQQTLDELLKKADIAMYQAKAAGRNTIRFYDPEMQAAVTRRATLEADLRGAVAGGQLLLYYQAQVDGVGRLTGAEVLVRWQHPQRGLVSPAEFIPLAEETGLILPVGHWVLETACAQLAAWGASALSHCSLAVNVSAKQFLHPDFVAQVLAVLDKTGADPRKLKLELTESLFLNSVEGTIGKMATLKARGVTFSLDDFGTGYSSLNYLKRLPLDQLKIDQSFVRDVFTSANDAAIVRTIIALAQSLGLAVIAEGVETEEQRQFLASAGCQAFQGYLFSRPLPLAAFEQFLVQHLADKAGPSVKTIAPSI